MNSQTIMKMLFACNLFVQGKCYSTVPANSHFVFYQNCSKVSPCSIGKFDFHQKSKIEFFHCLNGIESKNIGPVFFLLILKKYLELIRRFSFSYLNTLFRARQTVSLRYLSRSKQRIPLVAIILIIL